MAALRKRIWLFISAPLVIRNLRASGCDGISDYSEYDASRGATDAVSRVANELPVSDADVCG
jgi:hypothetical protein